MLCIYYVIVFFEKKKTAQHAMIYPNVKIKMIVRQQ